MPSYRENVIPIRISKIRPRPRNVGVNVVLFTSILFGAHLHDVPSTRAACTDSPRVGVDWTGCDKRHLHLQNEDLSAAMLSEADLSRSDFLEARLRRVELSKANLSRTRFDDADLQGADLSKAHAYRAQFRGADLSRAHLDGTDFQRAGFSGAIPVNARLVEANLQKASLGKANLRQADLRRSNLMRADLRGADLAGADLTGAKLYRTRMEGVDLSGARGIAATQIVEACGDSTTRLPIDITRPANWPCIDGD